VGNLLENLLNCISFEAATTLIEERMFQTFKRKVEIKEVESDGPSNEEFQI